MSKIDITLFDNYGFLTPKSQPNDFWMAGHDIAFNYENNTGFIGETKSGLPDTLLMQLEGELRLAFTPDMLYLSDGVNLGINGYEEFFETSDPVLDSTNGVLLYARDTEDWLYMANQQGLHKLRTSNTYDTVINGTGQLKASEPLTITHNLGDPLDGTFNVQVTVRGSSAGAAVSVDQFANYFTIYTDSVNYINVNYFTYIV